MVFISGYKSELYTKTLTKDRGWSELVLNSVTKGNNGKSFAREEVVWFNEAYTRASRDNKIKLRLSKKEAQNKKINPVRVK